MLASVVGPKVAATDLKSSVDKPPIDKDFKGNGSDSSFGKALDDKMSTKPQPKETKESSPKEAKVDREKDKPDKPEDPKAKKTEPEVARAENKPTKKATGRQQAIQDFMDSFESEFEIPPTRLVEAMAKLDDSQLTKAPEDTAQAVIDQLDLPPEDAEKAQAMYAGLLVQLNQMPVPPKAPVMMAGQGLTHQGMQDRIVSAQGRQDMMMKSVQDLNQKFWSNPKVTSPDASLAGLQTRSLGMPQEGMQNIALDESLTMDTDASEGMDTSAMAEAPTQTQQQQVDSLLEKLPPHLRGQMKESMSPALLAAVAAKQAAAQQAQAQAQQESEGSDSAPLMEEFQQAAQAPKAAAPSAGLGIAGLSMQGKNQANAEQFNSQQQQQDSSFMQQSPSQNMAKMAASSKEEAAGSILKKADFKQSLTGMEAVHGAPIKGESLKPELGMPVAAPVAAGAAPTQAENEAAVKQIMNQAQYLIKKGGGEMNVQMTPEGMGTIHLKVMLQDGKVNMQMSADTQEAKKTIESSLAELKTSLAAHKLSMENVKVDVVNSTSTDTATQNQTNMNGQNQRDQQTRQFWNQFNDNFGSQGRQESMMDFQNGLRGYGKKRDPLQPIETASKASARSVEGKGSAVNLVA